jgi:type IV pilus assembly protein PilQ
MVVKLERSTIGEEVTIQGAPYFTINKKNATSQVRVKDGQTVVIGGLVRTDETRDEQSVPFFSKIPILGLAFRNKTETKVFDETLIFLTPHVVNSEKS